MRRTRIVALAVVVVLGVLGSAGGGPAGAGGGTYLVPDRESYHPGDVVHLSAIVTKLDRDWYGPYTVKLQSYGGVVPGSEDGFPVGRLVVTRLDDTTVRAEVTFVLPKLPDGQWMTSYCSADCNHMLGDLSGGLLLIGDPPPLPSFPPTTVATTVPTTRRAVTTTAAPATTAAPVEQRLAAAPGDDGAGSGDGAILAGFLLGVVVALVLVGLVAVVERRRRSEPRRVITSSGAVGGDPADPPVVPVGLERDADERTVGAGR